MEFKDARLNREFKTIRLMIERYCRDLHKTSDGVLCEECAQLLDYAKARLLKCPFQGDKPTCAKCPIHCYSPEKRMKIKEVMRYAGPKLLWTNPILTVLHLLDERREPPPIPKKP
ncbi:MAG: nitrous oxide-stimulated promoter family protein [Verrucomicrobiia bacterium]